MNKNQNGKPVDQRCGYCLRGTEKLIKIELTPDGGRTRLYPILACAPCREYLFGMYRIVKNKSKLCPVCGDEMEYAEWYNRSATDIRKYKLPRWKCPKCDHEEPIKEAR